MRIAPASLFLPFVGCVFAAETPPPRLYPIGPVEMAYAPPATLPTTTCIPLLQADHIDRPVEVIATFDVPAKMGDDNDALAELRACAAAVGAHAVLDVQFRGGEDTDEPRVLSGVAVRFIEPSPPYPPRISSSFSPGQSHPAEDQSDQPQHKRPSATDDSVAGARTTVGDSQDQPAVDQSDDPRDESHDDSE